MKQSRGRAVLGGTIFAATIAVAGYAFTASNSVPETKAGDGAGVVSGYQVTSVHYVLDGTDPTKANSVTFSLDSTPVGGSTIKTKVGATWYTCTNAIAVVTCPTTSPQATVEPIASLEVVVAD